MPVPDVQLILHGYLSIFQGDDLTIITANSQLLGGS